MLAGLGGIGGFLSGASGPSPVTPFILEPPESADFSITLNSPTLVDGTESLRITGSRDASLIRGVLRPLPGVGDFSVIVQMHANLVTNANGAGIIFRDTAGKYIGINNVLSNAPNRFSSITQYSDHTTYSGADAGGRIHGLTAFPTWLKAVFDSTNNDVEGFISYTEEGPWESIGTSTYLGTADAIGIGITHSQAAGTDEAHAFFKYFEVQ